jgi:Polyphosphate kinase 2 (PPK2)
MFAHTDTKRAPWYVVNADDKKRARLNCIAHLLGVGGKNGKNNNATEKYYSCAVFLSDGPLLLPMTQMRGIKTEMRRTNSKRFGRM